MSRMNPVDRKRLIIKAAVDVSERDGFNNVRREDIAKAAGVSEGLVSQYLGTMKSLKRTVMRHAVKEERLSIIAQGLINKDPYAMKAPVAVKEAATRSLM